MSKAWSKYLSLLVLLALPSLAEIRVPLVIHNNTDATLTITLTSTAQHEQVYGEYVVPPATAKRFPGALHLGYTTLIVEALRCNGVSPVQRDIYLNSSSQGAAFEFFPKDFGKTYMADAPDRGSSAAELDIVGTWAWFVNGDVIFRADGTMVQGGRSGQWAQHGRDVQLMWNHGFYDYLTLSADGRELTGYGSRVPGATTGHKVSGRRK